MPLLDNSSMVLINEFLPNPDGADAAGEWVELWNNGKSALQLDGWRLTADGKKFFNLHGTMNAGAYLVLPRSASKLTLKNTDGALALYDPTGHLEDKASFLGTAPSGQSANRTQTGFFFSKPTPGAPNAVAQTNPLAYHSAYPLNTSLGSAPVQPPTAQFLGGLFGTAMVLAATILFILKSHEGLSHTFFQGDPGVGSGHR